MIQQKQDQTEVKQLINNYTDRDKHSNELSILQQKNISYFANKYNSDLQSGLTHKNVTKNKKEYGSNTHAKKQLKTFCELLKQPFEDDMLRILIGAAIVSMIVQLIYSEERSKFWVEGVSILTAVLVVALVTSISDYQKQKQFEDLNNLWQQNCTYQIIRDGNVEQIRSDEIVVGDIVLIRAGMEIPVDGMLCLSVDVIMDESSITGESNEVYKNVLEKCIIQSTLQKSSPIIISGSKVMNGQGKMITLLVGENSVVGKLNLMINDNNQNDQTPLQIKLEALASKIGYFGLYSAIIVFVILLIRMIIGDIIPQGFNFSKNIEQIIKYVIISVAIVVVAVPQGLPLAVTLSLAFSVKKMLSENNFVKKLASCQTMGGAHYICTDKTGTLTLNDMYVVQLWNGTSYHLSELSTWTHSLEKNYKQLILNVIAHNTSAVLMPKQKGSSTEIALLRLGTILNDKYNFMDYRNRYVNQGYFLRLPFNSSRKRITTGLTIIDQSIPNGHYIFTSGASEELLHVCQYMHNAQNGKISPLNPKQVGQQIDKMADKGLRTIILAYKEVEKPVHNSNIGQYESIQRIQKDGFTMLLIVGIQDLPRPEVAHAIEQCRQAGVTVIMVTGDNKRTARNIANQVGITYKREGEGVCMEGQQFQNKLRSCQTDEQRYQCIKDLRILSRSKPQHKLKLVEILKSTQKVVAVTGDGTNDAPALIKADVGFAMGQTGTQVAKNASDIVILDDNFLSVVRALVWGRNIYDSIRKFLQFQLTVNLVACSLSVLSVALIRQPVLTAIQMLWVNMIMDSLASLALATEPPNSEQLLRRKPYSRDQNLITKMMLKHVIGQSIFQLTTLILLLFLGQQFLPEYRDEFDSVIEQDLAAKYNNGQVQGTMVNGCFYKISGSPAYFTYFEKYHVHSRHFTFIFNTFVLMQIFNFFNCRKISDQINIFSGLCSNYLYLIILAFITIMQIIIVQLLNLFFNLYEYHGLTSQHWLICIAIASLGIPISLLIRCIPYGSDLENPIFAKEGHQILQQEQ